MAPTRERRRRLNLGSIVTAVVTAILCGGQTIAAQERTSKERTLKPEQRSGGWQERVPVSGGIRVGVVFWQVGKFDPRRLSVTLPKLPESVNRLCVEISSRDGRYSAQLQYRIDKELPGAIVAEVDTPDLDKLNAAAGEDVAILASLNTDCRIGSPAAYLVAGWNVAKPDDTVVVLLNSRVPTTIVGASGPIPCTEISGVTTAYNLRCDLTAKSIDSISAVKGKLPLGILQKRGRGETTVPLPLIVTR